jgi:SAM-dependent methyltransferase
MYPVEIRHEQTERAERLAYDALFAADEIRMPDSFYLWFVRLVARSGSGQLLDISCGDGVFLAVARRAGLRATGVDFSAVALKKTLQIVPEAAVAIANGQQLPFGDNSFDVVTNIGSLEHYFDPAEGVREMARVLRPTGVALVLLPNLFGLFGNITYVLRHGEVYDDGQPLQRYATRRSWERLLRDNQLIPQDVLRYEREAPRTLYDLRQLLRRPQRIARLLAAPLLPLNLSNNFIFICRKA